MIKLPLTTKNFKMSVRLNGNGFKLTHLKTETVDYLTSSQGEEIIDYGYDANGTWDNECFDEGAQEHMRDLLRVSENEVDYIAATQGRGQARYYANN